MAEMTQEDYPSQVIDTSFLEKQEIVTPSDNDVIVFSNFSEMTVSHDNLLQMEREMEKEDLQERLFILQGQKDKIEKDPKKAFLQLEEERLNNDGKISLSNDQGICCRSMSTPFKSSTNSVTETSGNLENTPGSTESPDCSAADKEPSAMNCDKSNGTIVRDMEKTSKQKDDLPKPTAVVKEIKSNADGKKSEMKSETYSKTKTKSEPAKEDKVESSEETVLKSDNQQADKTPALKKSHSQADKPNQKQSNQRSQGKQSQPQATKPAEQPKKKSSRQRFKDINKKDTGGDLMDAYTEKKPSPEVHEGFIQNIAQPYPLPVSTASLQPKNISQTQPPLYNGMPPMYYSHMQSNQPIQPQQTQQQPAPNTGISTNTKKARSKRPSKIIIKDPNSKKDITEEIRTHSGTANGRSTATPPLANTAAQTESSAIQAEFAAKVEARRAGGKLYGEKSEGTNKEKPSQGEKSRIDLKIIENGKTPRDQEVKDCPMQIEKNSAKNAKLKNANVVDNSKKEDEMDFEAQQSSSNMKEKTKEETSYETEVKVLKADREQNGNIESDVEISYRRKEPDDVEKKILTKSDHLDFVTQKNGTELKSDLDSKQMTENNKESPNNSVATSDNIVSTSDNIVAASDNIFATSDHNPETRAKASFDKNQTPDPSAVTHYKNLIPPDDSEATPDIKPDTADNCAGTPENSTATLPQSRTGSSGGGSQRSEFLPSYARPKNQPGGGKRDSRSKPPRKIIPMAPHPVVVLNKSENRWLRPKEREKGLSEEEKTTAELYRNVMAILNKLTPQKFKTLVEKMMALNIDSCERLEGVIDIIFEKAIGEPVFSVAYANMCRCLFTLKINDADGNVVSFRKLLLNRCQKEFEKEKEDEALLEKQKLEQLEGLSEEEQKAKREELDEDLAKNKRRMLGNIKFIGELFKLKLLTENIMHDCIFKLLRAGDEESLESMCKLLFTIGKHLDSEKAKPRIVQYFDKINKIIIAKKVSWRVIFILRDVVDLRDNKWVPRREEHVNPKTIDQIHKEAEMEKQQEQKLVSQLPAKDKQQIKKGSSGGRDSPKPVANDGWITTGKGGKSQPIDQNKLRNMAKRANNEQISLGPSSRFGQWGRGSSAGLSNFSQEQEQPQGNRYSALQSSSGDPSSGRFLYDPRRSNSTGARTSSAGPRGSDKSRKKSGRESAIEAARALSNTSSEKSHYTIQPLSSQEKQPEVKENENKNEMVNESLSEEELAKKTIALIDKYANIKDIKEAVACFTDLNSPSLHYFFVSTSVEYTYEKSMKVRGDTGRLLAELLSLNKLSKEQLLKGFNNIFEAADENSMDYPKLWNYLAEIINPLLGDRLKLNDLKPLILQHLAPIGKAAVLFAEILLEFKKSTCESEVVKLWNELEIDWSNILPPRLTIDEFLSRKNLNFLSSEANDELLKLLCASQLRNDIVFAHIEKNFKEKKRKEAEFINYLVSSVAESCLIKKEKETGPDCCEEKLKARRDILKKYLDNNMKLQLEALFTLQKIYAKYDKPKDMLSKFFNTLYDEEVITEGAFLNWKQDEDHSRQEAKGLALQATSSFFEWLQSAAVEGGEN
ncbi:eukaryotic translation initiation factor 4 gamma 3-like isoform X3 [Xenia sp. Carnegie-2017]|uniref:eukaryotic translation initiation factor 4 gamma 3-like isoform X3 n=1 Tax=Xenia sp. Carnegie-2017 TaxID=2897299 RepID=UPI001F04ED79|nr:eukaryotic translation initiation factor 4 gamma 3-like isoform X3 [Xenia sp. Carnegie-2017]